MCHRRQSIWIWTLRKYLAIRFSSSYSWLKQSFLTWIARCNLLTLKYSNKLSVSLMCYDLCSSVFKMVIKSIWLFSQFCNEFIPFNGIRNCLVELITLSKQKKLIKIPFLDCVAQTKMICLIEVKFSSTNLFEETLMSDTHLPSELQTMLRSCTQRAFYIIEKSLQRENNLRALEPSISKDICVLECFGIYYIMHF